MKSNKSPLTYIIYIIVVLAIAAAYYFFIHKKDEKENVNKSSTTTSTNAKADLTGAAAQTAVLSPTAPRIDTPPNVPDVNLGDIDTAIVSTYLKPTGESVLIEGLSTISNVAVLINKQIVTNPITLPGVVAGQKIFWYPLGKETAVNEVEIRISGGAIDLQAINEISVVVTKGENNTVVLESSPIEDVKSVNIFKFGN